MLRPDPSCFFSTATESFTYDPVGNRLTSADVQGNWAYNENNELQGYNNVTYEYDDNGNVTQKTDQIGTTTYTYDVENRLIQLITPNSQLVTYYYDPFGRRLWKEVGGAKTYFFYSDEGLIGEYNASGIEIKTYGYAPNSTWTTSPLFQKIGTNYYWYQNDHLGTPQKIIDINGRVVWSATSDAFGKIQIQVAEIGNNLRFPGQYYDQETGLHYNWNRYYDPQTGRYLTLDPIGLEDGINLFAYVKNNPITFIDPTGLALCNWVGEGPKTTIYGLWTFEYINPHDNKLLIFIRPFNIKCVYSRVLVLVSNNRTGTKYSSGGSLSISS